MNNFSKNILETLFEKRIPFFVSLILATIILFNLLFPLPDFKEYSKEIIAKDGTLLHAYLTKDDKWRLKTDIDEVNPELIKAIIDKEDKWFYWHFGVNPIAIFRALVSNITKGETVSGASTITMQVVRLLERKERTYSNKLIEIVRAVQLELLYSKKEILEMYLSLLPFGGNIEGVKSASYIYFNKPPQNLSLSQSILLTIIPNDPNSLRLDRLNNYAIEKRNNWIKSFLNENLFPADQLNDALDEPVYFKRNEMPKLAPHFSHFVKNKFDENKINTSLDLRLQLISEELLKNHVQRNILKGITNGAVIVIDNKTNSVAAYCGSADFYDEINYGQVNGITSIRSPGSALKPALFALNFDEGTLTPQMRLADIPTDFSGYEPENYDQVFSGIVKADFALVNSLNIPAVNLLHTTGLEKFLNLLGYSGLKNIQEQKSKLGLSVILGGCGVTLEELTQLFTIFAQGGKFIHLNYKEVSSVQSKQQIFSEETCYLIAKILSGIERKDIVDLNFYSRLPKFAWKTGTSYGKRDAWAVGFNPDYTIGVWMGNFDGKGSPHLSGAEASVPLLFDLFNAINYDSNNKWFKQPDNIYKRKVCTETGLLPTSLCTSLSEDYAIKNRSHNNMCNLHQEIYVNKDETIQYCTECLPQNNYQKKIYDIYEPETFVWMVANNYNFPRPPLHNDNCQAKFTSGGPNILSPSENYEYLIEEDSGQELMLLAASDSKTKTHYWFIDDKFFLKTFPGKKLFYSPRNGNLKITCIDDNGRDNSININVKYY